MATKVYSLVVRQGNGYQACDLEYVSQCGRAGSPHNQGHHFCGAYNLDHVVYMVHLETAERTLALLKAQFPTASIQSHDACASYITPSRSCVIPFYGAIPFTDEERCAKCRHANDIHRGNGYPGTRFICDCGCVAA